MIQENAFTPVLDALNALEIPYMIVGSYASNYWGRPRMLGTMFERKVWLTSAEDIILSKLLWYKMSPVLDRQLQDVLEVYEIQLPDLDIGYLENWAKQLAVDDLLERIREQAAT
ncbi:MAG: hypothetical protein KDE19_06550 [Caldilineaceae bacterium]|nr:hypothetical protein [Caldilineaceae bacterium]